MASDNNPGLGAYGGNPLKSLSDEVRFLIGDRSRNDPLFTDGEIAYCLARRGDDPLLAAEYALVCLLSFMAQFPDESVGPASVTNSQVFSNLQEQLQEIRRQIALDGGYMWVGGIDPWEGLRDLGNTKQPMFTRDMLQPAWDRSPPPGGYGRFGLRGWVDPLLGDCDGQPF